MFLKRGWKQGEYLLELVNLNGMMDVVIISANLLHANVFENPETSREMSTINNTFQTKDYNDDCKNTNQPSELDVGNARL